jgi:hypothetical protein
MSCEDAKRILERLDELEILLNTILEEVRELKKTRPQPKEGPKSFIEVLRDRRFMPLTDIKSRQALRQAMERGLVLVMRDEGQIGMLWC